ncbi:MAG TPA: hypothetical protein VNJ52_05205 [Patescibacteria group bacterium]|nr:hypothetical protein [Patescibacteria group bacterium]
MRMVEYMRGRGRRRLGLRMMMTPGSFVNRRRMVSGDTLHILASSFTR